MGFTVCIGHVCPTCLGKKQPIRHLGAHDVREGVRIEARRALHFAVDALRGSAYVLNAEHGALHCLEEPGSGQAFFCAAAGENHDAINL